MPVVHPATLHGAATAIRGHLAFYVLQKDEACNVQRLPEGFPKNVGYNNLELKSFHRVTHKNKAVPAVIRKPCLVLFFSIILWKNNVKTT